MFPEFLISGGIMFKILGSRYLRLFKPLLIVPVGPIMKSVCGRRLYSIFRYNVTRNIAYGFVQLYP